MAKSKRNTDADVVAEIEAALKGKKSSPIPIENFVSSGSTPLDLGCSGNSRGAFAKGKYYLIVGDTNTGKTGLTMTIFAEAANNPNFDDYDLLFINSEHGAAMDKAKHYGDKMAERLEETNPATLEECYDYLDDKFDSGRPFVAILDSMDALIPKAALARHKKAKKAREAGNEEKGSFATEKPKINSDKLRIVVSKLQKTGSILIIISQTRQRIGFGSQFDPKTFSGGDALTFYARLQIWTKLRQNIKKKIKGKDRTVGKDVQIRIKKNHITGWEGLLNIRIYKLLVDDVGGMIEWLIEEGHWKGGGKKSITVTAPEFNFSGRREDLVQKIESTNKEGKLRKLVKKVFLEIEAASKPKRKTRYK